MERPSHKTPRVDCLEGQRPRLTHFSTTGEAESLSDSTATQPPSIRPLRISQNK